MTMLVPYTDREIRLRFACIPEGGLAAFYRTDPEWEDRRPVYVTGGTPGALDWRPSLLKNKILVSMFDSCPYVDLEPYEYRLWNEHVIMELASFLSGSGTLTISHRLCWPWHFGLSWSEYPLWPISANVTNTPPFWWRAEDVWGNLPDGGYAELAVRLERRQYHRNLEWNRRAALHRLRIEQGLIPPPRRQTEEERERFRRRLEEALDAALSGRRRPPAPQLTWPEVLQLTGIVG